MKRLHKYELISIAAILVLILIYYINSYIGYISLENFKSAILSLGIFAPIIFILIFIILALVGFPVSILYFITGFLFGLVYGYFLSIFCAILSAIIAFLISRYISSKYIQKQQKKLKTNNFTGRLIVNIKEKAKNHGFYNILLLRLYFMPYIGLSYAAGLVKELKFRDFAFATFLINFFESFVFIFLGVAFLENIYIFFVALTFVVIFISIPRFFKKHHLNIHFKKH